MTKEGEHGLDKPIWSLQNAQNELKEQNIRQRQELSKAVFERVPQMLEDIDAIRKDNPAKAAHIVLELMEYCLPKLQRHVDQYGDDVKPDQNIIGFQIVMPDSNQPTISCVSSPVSDDIPPK
jgi:hypothetical protein